jgi:F0F1-type ATP synthase assembly protein I
MRRRKEYVEREEEMVDDSVDRSTSGRGYAYGGPALVGGVIVGVGIGILLDDFWPWL